MNRKRMMMRGLEYMRMKEMISWLKLGIWMMKKKPSDKDMIKLKTTKI
jgi:hypothetical protein